MKKKKEQSGWFRTHRSVLIAVSVMLVLSIAAGVWSSWSRREDYLPGLRGEVTAITKLPEENLTACALSRPGDSILLLMSMGGSLENYYITEQNMALQSLFPVQTSVGGILNTETQFGEIQQLVVFERNKTAMTMKVQVNLPDKQEDSRIRWQNASVNEEYGRIIYQAVGVDDQGRAALFFGEAVSGIPEVELVDLGDRVYSLAGIDKNDLLWIGVPRENGGEAAERGIVYQRVRGNFRTDLLGSAVRMPDRIVYDEDIAYVADSATGDIYRIPPNKDPELFRSGKDEIPHHIHQYREFSKYGIERDDKGRDYVYGVIEEDGNVKIAGDRLDWITDVYMQISQILPLYWENFWPAALLVFLVLSALYWGVERVFRSRRLSTRLLICELTVVVLLLSVMVGSQYFEHMGEEAQQERQQLQLIGGNLAAGLSVDTPMSSLELYQYMTGSWNQISDIIPQQRQSYEIRVIWMEEDKPPTIGYDRDRLAGYPLKNVETKAYCKQVAEIIRGEQESDICRVRSRNTTDYLYLQRIRQGDRDGCLAVSKPEENMNRVSMGIIIHLLPILAVTPVLLLALLWITRKLLSPLDTIRAALEEFYTCGGGNQMELDKMPHTELYEVGRVFNQLSTETRVQMNTLHSINDAYARMVPNSMLRLLKAPDMAALEAGKTVEEMRAILVIAPSFSAGKSGRDPELFNAMVEIVGTQGGTVVDHDEQLGALTALFPEQDTARDCGHACAESGKPVMVAVFRENVRFGVFGGDHLLFPMALTTRMARRLAVLGLLRQFGAQVILCDSREGDLRLLGWDDGQAFYEEISWHSAEWQSQWKEAEPAWKEAMELYQKGKFDKAMRQFAKVLRLMPEDQAARWYLFRCEALRDQRGQLVTDLLDDWGNAP